MRLMNVTLRPARVIEVLEAGNIKVEAPGLFSREDKDNLPPVMPFFGEHANSFSAPNEGDEVWVLSQSDNPQGLFWFRKDDAKHDIPDLIKGENCEVLCCRENGRGWATIYFEDGSGWIISNNEAKINIKKDGTILLDTGNYAIDINDMGISLGSQGQSAHPVPYGDMLEDILDDIRTALETIRQAANTNVYTKPIGIALGNLPSTIKSKIPNISSPVVTVD